MKSLLFTILALAFFSFKPSAQNWTGALNSDWNNAANWSSWPLNGLDITINPDFYTGIAQHPEISVNSVFSPALVLIENGGQLTVAANLTTQDNIEAFGVGTQLIMNAGTLNVNPGGGGRLIIDLGSTMTINGGNTIVDERFIAGEDAVITINGGIASSGERLLMDLGGKFIQHNGTVSVAAVFAMADGSINSNSSYELNGGTLSISGEMAFENEAGNFEPYFVMNDGTLNVNGDVFWFGAAPGSGTPRFLLNGGTANITGMIQNLPLSTVNMYLKIDGTSTLNYNGTLIETIQASDSIIQKGNSTWILNNSQTINNLGVLRVENTTTTFNGNTVLQGTGVYQWHHVLIQPTKTLNYLNPALMYVSGDFMKSGTYIGNSNTLVLNGTDGQTLDGSGAFTLHHLTLENTNLAGVTTNLPITLSGHLQLNSGKLNTSDLALLNVTDNATASQGNAVSFVNGPMTKAGNDPFSFPIGKGTKWRRLSMSAPADMNSVFRAEYLDNSYPNVFPVNAPLNSVSAIEYWQMDQLAGTNESLDLTLFWEDAASSAITDCNALSIARWNNAAWENVLSTTTGSCAGNDAGAITSVNSVNAFGAFTFGFYSGVTSQQIQFCEGGSITVGPSTYTNTGIYIDILQDVNLEDSIVITNLTVNPIYTVNNPQIICEGGSYLIGANSYTTAGIYTDVLSSQFGCDSTVITDLSVINANTNVSVSGITLTSEVSGAVGYQWLDCNANFASIAGETGQSFTPTNNGSYALLIQENTCVDTSACFVISTIGIGEHDTSAEISVYPNPFTEKIHLNGLASETVILKVFNLSGNLVYKSAFDPQTEISIKPNLYPGVYYLVIESESQYATQRLIKH